MSDENAAVDAFETLGLTSYEAKVFIALHRLGAGTARDVADVTDVPRSQVYSVAESLESKGLLEVQQSNPIRYRPVSVDTARETLRNQFEREQDRAFEYVETVKNEPSGEETQEDIWTVRGRDRVTDRIIELVSKADDRIIFGTRLSELVTDSIERTLSERAAAGVSVVIVSRTPAIHERFADHEGIVVDTPPSHRGDDQRSGRIAVADDDSILLSVLGGESGETAIWSSESVFASVLIQLIEASDEVRGD
ncbi:TrmB family transcriptional regulator [Natrinema thermotolerans]|uniref:TrmB family transcriptional regulator n=1 Tax=Natrinema thermotolerans TaxID=121872 RepID=A0AAF0P9X8_9EURY|nr:helix-turn-helix domain-containing protein [Natrinema thermotolerans]ELZ09605.1 transcriptional regulator, TrmB [Natrinema thermotolerans DSM 11552]QCC60181.1 TrmB family transcriptional regulator [Natrinema thermotolerans]WMT07195.1 TrmB family transcriptional regulator [Natrinema thermotolerans]